MALNVLVDSRDARFVLFELLDLVSLKDKYLLFKDYDQETYEEFLDLAERIAVEQIYPVNAEGDKIGCVYDGKTKKVTIPHVYREGLRAYYDAGFISMSDEIEAGGMGMPFELGLACNEYFIAASIPLLMFPGLSHGALRLISDYGTDDMKKLYIDNMISGQWGGTMCMTEPDAGSDVGLLKSKAVKRDDGSFNIIGQNIFISSGENDYYENIIHLKLARIEGDPAGTKGLSIFLVPKYRVNPDGSLGEFNDVTCAGIEHKMGIKGSSTCTMSFGDNGDCIGYLLGEERQGIHIMFQMMNEERLMVGLMGLAVSSSAYMHAVTYARNRVQGKEVAQMLNPEAEPTTIINHPDVKRMLLWMKAYVEGMRVLSYFLGRCYTEEMYSADETEKREAQALGDFLRPVLKAGNTDMSVLVTSEAVQTYGGYGYCSDYPVEQLMRDSKITCIYEGTNGIQAMDFTMRKLLMNKEQYNYSVLKSRIEKTIHESRGIVDDVYIDIVSRGLEQLDAVVAMMLDQMSKGRYLHLFMNATPLQQAMHMLVLAWCHLWSLKEAYPRMKELLGDAKGKERERILAENNEAAFYAGRVLSAQFYIGSEFQHYFGKINYIISGESAVIKASEHVFTGAPLE